MSARSRARSRPTAVASSSVTSRGRVTSSVARRCREVPLLFAAERSARTVSGRGSARRCGAPSRYPIVDAEGASVLAGSSSTHSSWRRRGGGGPECRTGGGAGSVPVTAIERAPLRATLPHVRGKLAPVGRFAVWARPAGEGLPAWGLCAATGGFLDGRLASRGVPAGDLLPGDIPVPRLLAGGLLSEDLPGKGADLLTGARGESPLAGRSGRSLPLATP
jgi:hypothetical protein